MFQSWHQQYRMINFLQRVSNEPTGCFSSKSDQYMQVEFPSNKNRLAVSSKCSFTLLWAGLSQGSNFRQVSFLIYESLRINYYKCFLMLKLYRTWSPISAWMVSCRVKRLKSGFQNLYLRTQWGQILHYHNFRKNSVILFLQYIADIPVL